MAGITVYNNVVLPNRLLTAGIVGTQVRRNTRTRFASGRERVNVNQSRTTRRYAWGSVPMSVDDWQALEALYEVTDAGAYGFLMRDPKDHKVAAAAGLLYPYNSALLGTIGLGYGVPSYKLYKRYTSAGSVRTKDRAITRPIAVPTLTRGGSPVTLGASAGNAAIDYDTGTVTFVADSSSSVTAFTAGATTQITLTAALSGVAIGERLYLSGIVGTSATTLNGLSHLISNITGGGLNVYHLSVDTTGLTRTSGGTGYAYPQSTEALAWSGQFYVPVHFASDELDWELQRAGDYESRLMVGPSVALEEVFE